MERFQFMTKALCPEHDQQHVYVVVKVSDNGDTDFWKGCIYCAGAYRLVEGQPTQIEAKK